MMPPCAMSCATGAAFRSRGHAGGPASSLAPHPSCGVARKRFSLDAFMWVFVVPRPGGDEALRMGGEDDKHVHPDGGGRGGTRLPHVQGCLMLPHVQGCIMLPHVPWYPIPILPHSGHLQVGQQHFLDDISAFADYEEQYASGASHCASATQTGVDIAHVGGHPPPRQVWRHRKHVASMPRSFGCSYCARLTHGMGPA